MSLINQMLKDLDARHESESRQRLHRDVRALPPVSAPRPLPWLLGGALLLAAAGGGWLAYERFVAADSVPSPTPAVSAPVAVAPVAPETPVESAPVTPVPAEAVAPAVTEESSGLKLAAALDNPPDEPPARRAPPRAASAVAVPAPAAVPRVPDVPAAKAAAPAPAVIDKAPAAKSAGERADADYRRAVALASGGRAAEAVDLLLDALRQDGSHVAARQLLARLLVEQRRADEAMALLAEGLAAQPGQIQWAMLLARLQVDRGDLGAAARTLHGSQPYATSHADYQGFAGFVAHRLGRQKEAAEHYQAAVRLAPGEGRWWFGLGLALEAEQRAAEAREAFLRARTSGTLNADLVAIVDQKLR